MITKILFTLTVIIATMIFFKRQRAQQSARSAPVKTVMSESQKMFRQGAYLFLAFMVISAIGMFIFKLGDDYATVQVHVINTQTGQMSTYQAKQKDIKSKSFITLEGRKVFVADVERIEVEAQE
jgi:hypothetical protein